MASPLSPPPPRATRARQVIWASAFTAWLGVTATALALLTSSASRAGAPSADVVTAWPDASKLPRPSGRAALVMIAHTKCACTRASLRELEKAMARSGGRVDALVIFVGPAADGLLDLRGTARAIPGVTVIEDPSEAQAFGARTSGQTYLFDERGQLLFRGGLTPSRGHEGASVGNETVRKAFTGSPPSGPITSSDVFGCALFNP